MDKDNTEGKKIRIIKRKEIPKRSYTPPSKDDRYNRYKPTPIPRTEEDEKAEELMEVVQKILGRVEDSVYGDTENYFLEDNQGKNIVLILRNGSEKQGKLIDIGNFGIFIQDNNIKKYMYKHSIVGYYIDK